MAKDVECHCWECTNCQETKLPAPVRVPLSNILIGWPWQMVVVDVLEVPVSYNQNRYLLVIQDYFTKRDQAIPMQDQTAARITEKLVKVFSVLGIPDVLHSNQGQNFGDTTGIRYCQVPHHSVSSTRRRYGRKDEAVLATIAPCVCWQRTSWLGSVIFPWFCLHTIQLYILQWVCLHFSSCSADNPSELTLTIN